MCHILMPCVQRASARHAVQNLRIISLLHFALSGQGLYGQTDLCWEAAGDLRERVSDDDFARGLTWDVRLALALMEATADPKVGGRFWELYARLLPRPHTVTVRGDASPHSAVSRDEVNRE